MEERHGIIPALSIFGTGLLIVSLLGFLLTFGPAAYFEVQYRLWKLSGIGHYIVEPISHMREGKFLGSNFISTHPNGISMLPIDTLFSVLIPKIGANAKITANVDPTEKSIYLPILKYSVAHAKGSALPDQNGSVYLFAHSTDNFWDVGLYNAVFYLLKELGKGDSVVLYYKQQRYNYTVTGSKIVDPSEVGYLVNAQKADKQLILQTCWPPGTTWKRLLVIAKPEE